MQDERIGSPNSAEQLTGLASPARSPAPAPVAAPGEWTPGQIVLDGYRVECELGEGVGGMGRVYLLVNPLTKAAFAVKRCKHLDEERQRRFLFELLTWADLPPHRNLLPLRFFRTDGNEVFLFSDYAEGGSLSDWIKEKRLTSLEQILDVAIQFAWGLHVGHEHGIVHQDVKPSNALMTADGCVMVGDFGLARSRAVVETGDGPPASLCVSHGGMTWAYCSPEQARQEDLTRRTDVWSWGLSVLEMFTGRPSWVQGGGLIAAAALEEHVRWARANPSDPAMPEWLVEVLRRCFREKEDERWETMAALVDVLREGWRQMTGSECPRELNPVPPLPPVAVEHDRRTPDGGTWKDPLIWLREALEINGMNPGEAVNLLPKQGRWRHTQAMADMVALREAALLLERAAASGNARAREQLAFLCAYDLTSVHESLDDRVGALPLYDRAIALLTRLVEQEGRTELANALAAACMNKAVALQSLGEGRAALPLYDRAIALRTRLVEQEGRTELANALAAACMNKANALQSLGEGRAALPLYDRAIALRTRLVEQEGRTELANALAAACMNKANALQSLGEGRAALPLYDRAIALLTRLVEQEGRTELANDLANACMNKAVALQSLGEGRAALPLYDRAIALRTRLVEQEGRTELANDLAAACMNKANALQSLGEGRAALPLYDRAIALLTRLVEQEGRTELANDLANACMNKAVALQSLGEGRAALPLYDRAIALRTRLVEQEGRTELVGDLAWVRFSRFHAQRTLGDPIDPALVHHNLAILRQEIERTRRADLRNVLDWAESAFRDLLDHE